MEITSINSKLLARMFLAGAKNLDSKKDWINELNVFPVPDGDTGTNMTMTNHVLRPRRSARSQSLPWQSLQRLFHQAL